MRRSPVVDQTIWKKIIVLITYQNKCMKKNQKPDEELGCFFIKTLRIMRLSVFFLLLFCWTNMGYFQLFTTNPFVSNHEKCTGNGRAG